MKKQSLVVHRDDFWTSASNKQLNFLQHVFTILKQHGRAVIVVPDNVLLKRQKDYRQVASEGAAGQRDVEFAALQLLFSMRMVSEKVLLEGSWYALEQAGRLLRASVVLFDSGDPGSALALAMFAREEFGRSRI